MSIPKLAVVAAMEREVAPFVKDWQTTRKEYDGQTFKFFEKENNVVVCGGVGAEAARRAAEAVIRWYEPGLIISAGFAGALDPTLQVGHTFTARHVIDARDGSRTDSGNGEGILISFETIADAQQKARFASAFGGHAVDMEAAAVARAAEAHGIKFLACKVISDTSDAHLPPLGRFIDKDGRFQTGKFTSYIAFRPWLWKGLWRLASDTMKAAQALGYKLEQHGREWTLTDNSNTADAQGFSGQGMR
jgi:adenosylhomocysteine nucleosidase